MNYLIKGLKKLGSAFVETCKEVKNVIAPVIGAGIVGASLHGTPALATGSDPIDFTATATTVAGYMQDAATAGLIVFAVWFGVAMIKRVFLTVA